MKVDLSHRERKSARGTSEYYSAVRSKYESNHLAERDDYISCPADVFPAARRQRRQLLAARLLPPPSDTGGHLAPVARRRECGPGLAPGSSACQRSFVA